MEKVEISQEMVKVQCRKMPNWKTHGTDGVEGYWLKNQSSSNLLRVFLNKGYDLAALLYVVVPQWIAVQLNHILDGERPFTDWMTFGKAVMCQKDSKAVMCSAVDNYRPISCLPFMWKLMTGMLPETMHSHLERENVLSSEQKRCCKGSHRTKTNCSLIKRY